MSKRAQRLRKTDGVRFHVSSSTHSVMSMGLPLSARRTKRYIASLPSPPMRVTSHSACDSRSLANCWKVRFGVRWNGNADTENLHTEVLLARNRLNHIQRDFGGYFGVFFV